MAKEQIDFYDKTLLKSYNLNETMRYQLSMLDSLDVFTRKHSENVASIVCRLCEYLHCSKNFSAYCTTCAYLHDIGKIFIPPNVLQKPGMLTDEEYETMKKHTMLGYRMCIENEKLRPYAFGAKYHHEALDGSGYPEGLTKKDIPYEAQIIKVADEYDAIVSKRQYKTHINISDTLKILIKETIPTRIGAKVGKLNKRVVKVLLRIVIEDIEYEISCLMDYIKHLKEQIKRLNCMEDYYNKMINANKEKTKNYYKEGIKILLSDRGNTRKFSFCA